VSKPRALIRPATIADSEPIAPLLAQLGYPTDPEEIPARMRRLAEAPDAGVFVAEAAGRLVGLAAFQIFELIYRPRPQCRLTALVVDRDHRRQAVGTALLEAVERCARERDCFRLELTTRPQRPDALPFYVALGFAERPHRLVKLLADCPPRSRGMLD